jgi:hypothetical protein
MPDDDCVGEKNDMVALARAAKTHNVQLRIRGAMMIEDMLEVIEAGEGHVAFDVSAK